VDDDGEMIKTGRIEFRFFDALKRMKFPCTVKYKKEISYMLKYNNVEL